MGAATVARDVDETRSGISRYGHLSAVAGDHEGIGIVLRGRDVDLGRRGQPRQLELQARRAQVLADRGERVLSTSLTSVTPHGILVTPHGARAGNRSSFFFDTAGKMERVELPDFPSTGLSGMLDVRGDAFLKNMVRIMVGTLVAVGRGQFGAERIDEVLASGDRTRSGSTAPAHGLELVEVVWPEPWRGASHHEDE